MVVKENTSTLLDAYRDEIRLKSPKSFSIWQQNRTVMPTDLGSLFWLADPIPMVVKHPDAGQTYSDPGNDRRWFVVQRHTARRTHAIFQDRIIPSVPLLSIVCQRHGNHQCPDSAFDVPFTGEITQKRQAD